MKHILLAILIITGVKILSEGAMLPYEYSFVKIVSPEDESKSEKEENKHSKRSFEDIFHSVIKEYLLFNSSTTFSSFNHHDNYSGLAKQPSTPPPDSI